MCKKKKWKFLSEKKAQEVHSGWLLHESTQLKKNIFVFQLLVQVILIVYRMDLDSQSVYVIPDGLDTNA